MDARIERPDAARARRWLAWLCLLALAVQMLGPALHRLHAHGACGASAPCSSVPVATAGDPHEHHDGTTCGLCQLFTLAKHHLAADPGGTHLAPERWRAIAPCVTRLTTPARPHDRPPARAPPFSCG